MTALVPAPSRIAELVNDYIRRERRDVGQYENREPFDESGNYTLHRLAAEIYAAGWADGFIQADVERRLNR